MSAPVKIGVLGAQGRMGRALLAIIADDPRAVLVAALVPQGAQDIGKVYGDIVLSCDVSDALDICDVLIDFSQPKAAIDAALLMYGSPCKTLVTGTTGYSQTDEQALIAAAESITLVKSGNFSIGVCIIESLVETAASRLGDDWDVDIFDAHHRHKKDAPSGTALMLGAAVKAADKNCDVAYTSQRRGGVIGAHDVTFSSPMETLTLSHRAEDRAVFAKGALAAALWAADKPKGLYGMKDVLGL